MKVSKVDIESFRVSAAMGWTIYTPCMNSGFESVFKRTDGLRHENKKAMKAEREYLFLIEIRSVSKFYKKTAAVQMIIFKIRPATVCSILQFFQRH